MNRGQKQTGFTIVELLIVIVVIAILAAITVVAFNGVQSRADTASKQNEMMAWKKAFMAYKSNSDGWPPSMVLNSYYCLGKGFPLGAGGVARCRDYQSGTTGYLESDNTTLMDELKTVTSVPDSTKKVIGPVVGPYVQLNASNIVIITHIFPVSIGTCPSGTIQQWANATLLWCEIRLQP